MDTSNQYIKMCEMATEIQDKIPYNIMPKYTRDPYIFRRLDCYFCSIRHSTARPPRYKIIWLPTQKQLQEMVNARPTKYQINELFNFRNKNLRIKTWQELWLKFVMWERFLKIWNGENWVKGGKP